MYHLQMGGTKSSGRIRTLVTMATYSFHILILFIPEAYVDIYADDTTVHTSNKDTNIIKSKLQVSSNDFKLYCIQNKMFVHLGKTLFMLIGSRQNISLNESIQIYVGNEIIKEVEYQKLLVCFVFVLIMV